MVYLSESVGVCVRLCVPEQQTGACAHTRTHKYNPTHTGSYSVNSQTSKYCVFKKRKPYVDESPERVAHLG